MALEREDDGMVSDGEALMTATELARVMGLRDPQQVLDLRRTAVRFPEPVGRINRSFVWSWSEVEAWGRVQARSAGRSPRSSSSCRGRPRR
jgi:predicted DNA-binding transcriptional regulator AlpA